MSDYRKNPDDVLKGSFSPKDIIDAFKNGDIADAFKAMGEKFANPFINVPKYAQSLDIRRVVIASAGTVDAPLLKFQPPKGMEAIITGYGIYSDAEFASETNFVPLLNGTRVFPYHGTPTDLNNPQKIPYKIALGLGPDLGNEYIIECNLRILDDQIFEWYISNTSLVDQVLGVRFKGYLRSIGRAQNYKIGG